MKKKKKQVLVPRVSQDELWKGIIEDMFDDFVRFFFPDFVEQIDFEKPFEFLNKELQELIPASESKNRRADLLIKVFLKNGFEKWFLIHVEVQGYEDADFSFRMYTYNYRIFDRFSADIMALAIFTDSNPNYRPNYYERVMGSTIARYDFAIYKLLDHDEAEFENSTNPFAVVMQVARSFIRNKPFETDEDLLSLKTQLLRRLLEKGFEPKRIRNLTNFIKFYVSFRSPSYLITFEKEFDKITKTKQIMGISELIAERTLEAAREVGREEGIFIGISKGVSKGISKGISTAIKKMLAKGFDTTVIAGILEIPILQVLKVQQERQIEAYFEEGKTLAQVQQLFQIAEQKMLLSEAELEEVYRATQGE